MAEKKAEKKKGSATGKVVGGVGVVGVLGAAVYLLTQCGGSFGFGGGGGGSESSQGSGAGETTTAVTAAADTTASSSSSQETETTVSSATVQTVGVTVNGNGYFYENHSCSLDDLMTALKKLESGTVVRITDENASLNAYNALIAELNAANISYLEASSET